MVARKHSDEAMKEALAGRTVDEAAALLGMHSRTLQTHKARFTRQGWSPEHGLRVPYADGFEMRKLTIQRNATGEIERTWERMCKDQQRQQELMQAAIEAMAEDLPRMAVADVPDSCNADLLNCYVITDYHLGLLSWHEETGDDYDLSIAEHQLVAWVAAAIRMAPDAEIGVLAQLGDYLHWDGLDAVTPTSRHLLDADTRFQKLVRVAIRVTRRVIDMLLTKHQKVHVLMAEGNHDTASSIWLREWFSAIYENEPRITVDRSPDPYYCVEHGQTSLFFHHGHKKKPTAVADVFVAKFRDVFGRTKHSYAHLGHLHHVDIKENNLMIVEQHRTLAAPDAYASRGGWISGRDAKVITYHKQYGEVGRLTINSDMLRG